MDFDATSGDHVTVQLIAKGGVMSLLPPDDIFSLAEAKVDPATGVAQICFQPLVVSGAYTLQIQNDPAATESTCSYLIRIEALGPPADTPLPVVTETLITKSSLMTVVRSPPCQGS